MSIATGLDPHGKPVPIEEAQRHKIDYYTCPECGEFLTPRVGEKRQYFAHKRGVLEDTSCSLSSQADVDEMVDDLRTSDIEEGEKERNIRLYLGAKYGESLECYGIIPSLEWDQIPPNTNVDSHLGNLDIETKCVQRPPVGNNFHPSEPEVVFTLDPTADEFSVQIDGPTVLDAVTGAWSSDGLKSGDLFVGDQNRARRYRSGRQIKLGEWVYLVVEETPHDLPAVVEPHELAQFTVLGFPARESTESLLEEYGEGLTTDKYGFNADILLPAHTHPTIEAPIHAAPESPVLVGVTPAEGIDPTFEVVTIPKDASSVVEIEPTGPGSPRYYDTNIPTEGSQRISIHQSNSNRHRLVHLHPDKETSQQPDVHDLGTIGIELVGEETVRLTPLGDVQEYTVSEDFNPNTLPSLLEYIGPTGLNIEIRATFHESSDFGPEITRFITSLDEVASEIAHWVTQGCTAVQFEFDGLGSVKLAFPQPALATAFGDQSQSSSSESTSIS